MKVQKINGQPDLSGFDETKYTLLRYSLNDDGETYTLNVKEIVNEKKQAYRNEVSDLLEQYTRLSLIGETEKIESILAEIKAITIEIRERYDR